MRLVARTIVAGLVAFLALAACVASAPDAAPAAPPAGTVTPVAAAPFGAALPPEADATPLPTATVQPTATAPPTATPLPTLTPTVIVGINNTARQLTAAQLVRVVDGNTIEVKIKGQTYRVRYLGIEPLSDSTAAAMNRRLVAGQALKLQRDITDTDPQGNLLRYVWAKTYMVNAELARLGYARAAPVPPDTVYQKLFQTMEQEARNKKRGMWAPGKLPGAVSPAPTGGVQNSTFVATPTPGR